MVYDVAIIGAGITGAMTARTLAAYRLSICIVDKGSDVALGATRANSAIVHAGFDAQSGSLKAKLNVRGSMMMERTACELGVKYKKNGSLVIGFDNEDRKSIDILLKRGIKNGVEGLRIIEHDELNALEPNISDNAKFALYAPTGAIVCPYELAIAAAGNAMDNGAELRLGFEVKQIVKTTHGYELISDDSMISARYVINAAGLYADKIASMIGDNSFTIHPRRGEYILLDKEYGEHVSHTIFKTPDEMGKGILVSPTVDGNLLTGPTSVDIEDKTDNSTTAEGFEKIISGATLTVKNIPFGRSSITSFCGLRAVGSTGDFIINSPAPGFINAAGIESPGLSASPAIAEYISDMLKDLGLELIKKDDYIPTRKPTHYFREADIKEKNRIIADDSSYGRVICRCETVTEGEILEALRTNPRPRDLDGIKRRTRAQMGRCQGGFCMPYIIELIASELGIEYEKVTKSGGGSYINTGKTK